MRASEVSVALVLGCGSPGHTGSQWADLSSHQTRTRSLTFAAASPWEEPSCCPRTRVQPTHTQLSGSCALGTVLGGGRDSAAEQMRNRWSKFQSLSFLEQRGGEGEPGKVCATGVCLFGLPGGEAVYWSLLQRGCAPCHILPLNGCKLIFSSGNVPFREKQGKLCHHGNMCEPLVRSLMVQRILHE